MAVRGMADWPWNDTEVEALPRSERLMLDAFRRWRDAAAAGRAPLPDLRLLLAAERAEAIAPALDALLRQAPGAAIGCPFCPRVTQDEAALLLLCELAQRGAGRGVAHAPAARGLCRTARGDHGGRTPAPRRPAAPPPAP